MKRTMFECDVCGDLRGHIMDMMEFEIRASHESHGDVRQRFGVPDTVDVHVCIDHVPEGAYDDLSDVAYAENYGYVGVSDYDCTVECMVVKEEQEVAVIDSDAMNAETIDFIEDNIRL